MWSTAPLRARAAWTYTFSFDVLALPTNCQANGGAALQFVFGAGTRLQRDPC
jgi:hypothetical protein